MNSTWDAWNIRRNNLLQFYFALKATSNEKHSFEIRITSDAIKVISRESFPIISSSHVSTSSNFGFALLQKADEGEKKKLFWLSCLNHKLAERMTNKQSVSPSLVLQLRTKLFIFRFASIFNAHLQDNRQVFHCNFCACTKNNFLLLSNDTKFNLYGAI